MASLQRFRRLFRDDETHFVELSRHFFSRFFDTELISRRGEPGLTLIHVLALLALPGAFYSLYLFPVYDYIDWYDLEALYQRLTLVDPCRLLTLSMVVVGMVTVLEWDALFPDRRDYAVLAPLPLKPSVIFSAKAAALAVFLALFVVDVNLLPSLIYPSVAMTGRPGSPLRLLGWVGVHAFSAVAGCAFVALFFVALQGVLVCFLSHRLFRKLSLVIQGVAMVALLSMFFLLPLFSLLLPAWLRAKSAALYALPPMWFLGLYETLLGRSEPIFRSLAELAVGTLGLVLVISATTYLLAYRRFLVRSAEEADRLPAGPSAIESWLTTLANRLVVRRPLERATFYFVAKTMVRSKKHRLFFAAYAGVGVALVIESVVSTFVAVRHAPLAEVEAALLSIPLILSFFVLSGIRAVFPIPAELSANWVFRLTENERRADCLSGVRKMMVVFGIAVLFSLLLPLQIVLWGWRAALFQLGFATVLALILLEVLLLGFFKVPFTCSYQPGKAKMTLLGFFYWLAFAIYAYTMAGFEAWLLSNPAWLPLFLAPAALVMAGLIVYRERLVQEGFAFVFDDAPDPAVQTLNLSS